MTFHFRQKPQGRKCHQNDAVIISTIRDEWQIWPTIWRAMTFAEIHYRKLRHHSQPRLTVSQFSKKHITKLITATFQVHRETFLSFLFLLLWLLWKFPLQRIAVDLLKLNAKAWVNFNISIYDDILTYRPKKQNKKTYVCLAHTGLDSGVSSYKTETSLLARVVPRPP